MSFYNLGYAPYAAIATILFLYLITRSYKNYFKWIKTYWFYKPSKYNKISFFFYFAFFTLLGMSVLDLRGNPEKIESTVPDQKTIIIIDASASMLVEDVRPNRFKKSLIMARHFVKKAVGHQIAVVLFSDMQKRLVPFTDDIDLLDARIAGLEEQDISKGGSNIGQAIRESIQYFKTELAPGEEVSGNILVFTDSEESSEAMEVKLPDEISLGIVGVGTLKGGKIPIRSKSGQFIGHKKHKNEYVISHLNEDYLKLLKDKVENYQYWIALSYSIPTEEIINFYKKAFIKKNEKKGLRTVRPVMSKYILIPAILCYLLSVLFSQFITFRKSVAMLLFLIVTSSSDNLKAEEPQKIDLESVSQSLDVMKDLLVFKSGGLDRTQRLKLAEKLIKLQQKEAAVNLYSELIKDPLSEAPEVRFNYGTSLMANKKLAEGMIILADLRRDTVNSDAEAVNKFRNNVLLALRSQGKDKGKGKDKEKKDKDQKGKSGESGESGENKNNKNNKNQQESKNKKQDNKKDKGDEKQKTPEEMKKNLQRDMSRKENNIKQKRKMVKIPAVLKQILHSDRDLQKKYLDTSTKAEKRDYENKDW